MLFIDASKTFATDKFVIIIENAKANVLNPLWYLYYIFEKIPLIKSDSEYGDLIANIIGKNVIETFQNEITDKSISLMN